MADTEDVEVCGQCGEEFKRIRTHWSLSSSCDNPYAVEWKDVVLFSGGHDSLVLAHYMMEERDADGILHIDTGTGLDENRQFVEDVCEEYGWPLEVRSPKVSLKEFALEYGFPEEAAHSWAYQYLKEHPMQAFASDCECDGKPIFHTGVRSDESERRMRTVGEEREERDRWIWNSPISGWTDEECDQYREEHDLPTNPVVQHIHRSGECYCGAFANRDEELLMLEAEYPDHAEWLLELEKEVQEEIGTDESYCWWGGNLGDDEVNQLSELKCDDNTDMLLCQNCSR